MPDSFPAFCTSMSLIFVCCEIAHFSYLLIFLIVTIINFRFSLRKSNKFTNKRTKKIDVVFTEYFDNVIIIRFNFTVILYKFNWIKLLWYMLDYSCIITAME